MSYEIQVLGINELIGRLATGLGLGEVALEQMQMDLAMQIQAYAKSIAPVDTGTLQDSIQIGQGPEGVTVFSDVPYAGFVEYGTSIPTPAQPYMRPAADSVDTEGATSIGAHIMNGI